MTTTPASGEPRRVWKTSFQLRELLIPRPLAWMSIRSTRSDTSQQLFLLSGFTSACYTPLTIMTSDPTNMLQTSSIVTVSLTTFRESKALEKIVNKEVGSNAFVTSYTFEELGLLPAASYESNNIGYPCAVEGSPIQFYGTVTTRQDDFVLIRVDSAVVDASVISEPTESMVKERSMTGKIDAELVDAMVDLGGMRFKPTRDYRSMPRPAPEEMSWKSTDFTQPISNQPPRKQDHAPMIWKPDVDGRSCALGFNPTTAMVLSRPIGWISTFSKTGVAHMAPYSFFMDVGPDLVAFSAYSANQKKDAQLDAEETGCFCYNMCTSDLAVAMNLSAAPLDRDGSEFALAGLIPGEAQVVSAPVVTESSVRFECEYVRTMDDVGGFSIVIGRVKGVSIDESVLEPDGTIDLDKVRPITRLGYMDEYGVL